MQRLRQYTYTYIYIHVHTYIFFNCFTQEIIKQIPLVSAALTYSNAPEINIFVFLVHTDMKQQQHQQL